MYACRIMLINRDDEVATLRKLALADDGPKLALLTGRRRVGKTFLLTHTWEADNYFIFTAARTSPKINRRQIIQDLSRFTKRTLHEADYPTWRSVFNLILDLRLEQPLAIVLDEFQYLAADTEGLAQVASELNAAWEQPREPQQLLIVLAGSAVSTLEALDTGGAPLFGRFDWRHKLFPFNYWYADQVAPFKSVRDRVATSGVFGGMPKYLSAIDTTRSLDENIAALHLAPNGLVRQLLETAIAQEEGLRDVASYNAILHVIAGGATTRNEIAQQAGLPNNTALIGRLDALQRFGWIRERKNIGRAKTHAIQYALNDAAMRFHYRFVEPHASMLARESPLVVWEKLKPRLPAYLGLEFEGVVEEAYTRLRAAHDLPLVKDWSRFEGVDRNRESLEIDIVAPLFSGGTLTGVIKWNEKPVGPRLHMEHIDMLQRAAQAGQSWAHDALLPSSPLLYVSAAGFTEGFREVIASEEGNRHVYLWDLADLYQDI